MLARCNCQATYRSTGAQSDTEEPAEYLVASWRLQCATLEDCIRIGMAGTEDDDEGEIFDYIRRSLLLLVQVPARWPAGRAWPSGYPEIVSEVPIREKLDLAPFCVENLRQTIETARAAKTPFVYGFSNVTGYYRIQVFVLLSTSHHRKRRNFTTAVSLLGAPEWRLVLWRRWSATSHAPAGHGTLPRVPQTLLVFVRLVPPPRLKWALPFFAVFSPCFFCIHYYIAIYKLNPSLLVALVLCSN